MKHIIYYFSGTGNSLAVARRLRELLPDAELSPMLSHRGNDRICPPSPHVGLVFPIHNFTMPALVRKFLECLDVRDTSYLYAVATRGGSPCRLFIHINRLLRKWGKVLDACYYIDMPNNWLLFWDAPSATEAGKMELTMLEKTAEIAAAVEKASLRREYPHGRFILEHVLFPLITGLNKLTRYFWLDKAFYADSKCNGCGICEKVCLSGKITVENGRPVWSNAAVCQFCFACIHYCPTEAIQFSKTKTPERRRYHHPDVSWREIASQKSHAE